MDEFSKDIVGTIGTVVTIIALVLAAVVGATFLKILAGAGIVYVMCAHDEYTRMREKMRKKNENEGE